MRFTFAGFDHDIPTGVVRFQYELEKDSVVTEFTETISYDPAIVPTGQNFPAPAIQRILENLFLILGISYWKTYCLKEIVIKPFTLTRNQAEFWNTVYTKGLGEFFYENKIDYRGLISFPYDEHAEPVSLTNVQTAETSLVMLGGGKDSIVTAEMLRKGGKPFSLITLSPTQIHEDVARAIGAPLVRVTRAIDPKLFELNKQPSVYNGHIPISAVYAWVDVLAAALTGSRYVVASNEESANYGNVEYLGSEINHQWSKSFEFETMLQDYLRSHVTRDIHYYSLLRPMKEIQIVEEFVKYPQYFPVFTSCNMNFRILEKQEYRWCGVCPKCAFVYLLLSAYLPKEELVGIFGKNLYDNASLLPLYRELLGLVGIKPFECVGTPEESKQAFDRAKQNKDYMNDPVITALKKEV